MDIVTLAPNPSIDTNTRADRIVPDVKLRCDEPRYEPGGGGVNVSRAIAKLGGDSLAVYPAGGATGEELSRLLAGEGLRVRTVPVVGLTRVNFTVGETGTGCQYRFVMPGSRLGEGDWAKLIGAVEELDEKPGYMVASGSLPRGAPADFYARLAGCCARNGVRMIVDTSGPPLAEAVREGVFLVKPNEREIGQLLGGAGMDDEKALVESVQRMAGETGTQYVVVSLGSGGALLISESGCTRYRAPDVEVRSAVGAGDSMVAGMVLKLAAGESIGRAVQFGIAAGASAVSTPGTELCDRALAEALYAGMAGER